MIAAIYARKSTEQTGADADAKSIARQIDNAQAFATAHGWTVADAHIYADDAISGAETRKLLNRQRLLDAIGTGRPPFQRLIMRDASRFSRRDGDEAFGELKRIAQAGIEIWFYQDDARFTFGSFGDNVVGFVRAEMNAEYRRQVAKWTHEAMLRKAKAGHVTGGACFGYDNVRVDGHVERRINEPQAAVIRQIYTLCAAGTGYSRIAKQLNAEQAPAPKPTRGRPAGWSPSTVHEVLRRPLYRGEVVYNRTRRRAPDGSTTFAPRPAADWVTLARPELRIVSDAAAQAVTTRLEGVRTRLKDIGFYHDAGGRRGRDSDSPYLLSGFARCACCGGSIGVVNHQRYGCIAYHKRGTTVCGNRLLKARGDVDTAVLDSLRQRLRPHAVLTAIERVFAQLTPATLTHEAERQRHLGQTLDREIANLTTAIAAGGQLPPLLEALTAKHAQRQAVTAALATHEATDLSRVDRGAIERTVRHCLADWNEHLAGRDVALARQALRELLVGPLRLTPEEGGYRFDGELLLNSVLFGHVGLPTNLVRPGAHSKGWITPFSGIAA